MGIIAAILSEYLVCGFREDMLSVAADWWQDNDCKDWEARVFALETLLLDNRRPLHSRYCFYNEDTGLYEPGCYFAFVWESNSGEIYKYPWKLRMDISKYPLNRAYGPSFKTELEAMIWAVEALAKYGQW